MDHKEKKTKVQTTKQINIGAGASGTAFALYLAAMALQWKAVAAIVAVLGVIIAIWACGSASELRRKDKEAVSYNLLWGTGALALLLAACAAAGIKQLFGL